MLRITLHAARPALLLSLTVIERLLLGSGRTFSIHVTVIVHVGSGVTDQRVWCMPVCVQWLIGSILHAQVAGVVCIHMLCTMLLLQGSGRESLVKVCCQDELSADLDSR